LSNLKKLDRPVDEELVTMLEGVLAEAKKGNINGAVVLYDMPTQRSCAMGGKVDIAYRMKAFAEWQLVALMQCMTEARGD
jgi:hypothetical protein